MKQNVLALGLTLALALIALSGISSDGRIRTDNKSNQNDAQKTEAPKPVYDIYGKRFRADEKYIGQRTLKNGRIIAYRNNKREIAALVKALKEDGVTDKTLLDPKTWSMIICEGSISSGCTGNCAVGRTCKRVYGEILDVVGLPDVRSEEVARTTPGPNLPGPRFHYCTCVLP